jgi:hypothetical protein
MMHIKPLHLLSLLLFSSIVPSAHSRDLIVEMEVQHVGGLLSPAEIKTMLASEGLTVEALYSPTRLIEGVTATRQRVMPIGTRLFAIAKYVYLKGNELERDDRTLRFRIADIPPGHDYYRLNLINVNAPAARGRGRPQPYLSISLLQETPGPEPRETAFFIVQNVFDLGVRVRYRWSDAKNPAQPSADKCHPDVQPLGGGTYRFRPRHSLAGFFTVLASDAASDPPTRPPPGQRSMRLKEPYPEPLTGWNIGRNHLIQLDSEGRVVERFSIYAEQTDSSNCRRTRAYDGLLGDTRLVEVRRSIHHYGCSADEETKNESVEASWLDDGSLARYVHSTPRSIVKWDAFIASRPADCGVDAAGSKPPSETMEALALEFQRIREAFQR